MNPGIRDVCMLTGTKTTEIPESTAEWGPYEAPLPRASAREASGLRMLAGHQLASVVSGAVDFVVMIGLVRYLSLSPTLATVFGAAAGAIVNFTLGRRLVFSDHSGHSGALAPQAARYALVSATSLMLNALGEYVLAERLQIQYVVARALVALSVSVLWNFPLQRHFVFRRSGI